MLYKLSKTDKIFNAMEPLPFRTFADCGQVEKDLENLLAGGIKEGLFEDMMPIFQQRPIQAEADIYALKKNGDLVIFELKTATAEAGAVHQVLRYCESAAPWDYDKLQRLYSKYMGDEEVDLQTEHKSIFGLETPLPKSAFNQQQLLMVVGSAGSDGLVRNIAYWRPKGIAIEFLPYRIYEIDGEHYFEFFSAPFDQHSNPAHRKGVLFDTCRTYIEDSIWYMCEKSRVAAFGDRKHVVGYLNTGDTVFLYHKWEGIIAAGRVKSGIKEDVDRDAMYRDLEWLTPLPGRENRKALNAARIKTVLGRDFFWAVTIKTPKLSVDETDTLLEALREHLGTP